MHNRLWSWIFVASAVFSTMAIAAVQTPTFSDLRLAEGVKRFSNYEPVPTKYIVANTSDVYADVTQASKVTGHLDRGQQIVALAKPKDWDWILVGKDGVGIGYISRGVIAPADQFKS